MQKILFYSVAILLCLGIIFSYSLSTYVSAVFDNPQAFLFRQFGSVAVSFLVIFIIAHCDIDKFFYWFGRLLMFASFGLMLLIFVGKSLDFVVSAGGATRWIRVGPISLAPLEFFKVAFVMLMADRLANKFVIGATHTLLNEIKNFAFYFFVIAVSFIVILLGLNDFGQLVVLSMVFCVMLYFSGGSKRLIGWILGLCALCGMLVIIFNPTRNARFGDWLNGFLNTLSSNAHTASTEPYQISQALNAIHYGGWWGHGIGEGILKLGFLSEVHTDMVLAGIAEEWGFVGFAFVALVFAFGVVVQILRIARRTTNKAYYVFCIGSACLLAFSFLMNAFGVAGTLPLKGIAVPFLSYGGSAMLANAIIIGLVLAIARQNYNRSTYKTDS
ncbi:FtsW/RodA/SpoVE family cell cycle protein [Helicobacter enhydrae]|nr:FtsW/RodA/SpoVE family cell cycle protein [Helicobacter enhydrae]